MVSAHKKNMKLKETPKFQVIKKNKRGEGGTENQQRVKIDK